MQQIIKQPNGLYCIFSTVVDNVTHYNLSKGAIIELRLKEAQARIEKEVEDLVSALDKGEKPYNQFTLPYDGMLDTIREAHGESEEKLVRGLTSDTEKPEK